ncbi:hypothetical protein F2Q65_11250 [Thiohalocapsa marina]|uniref:Uncharacterized protein n=1 Tax=Thiohalocapsa marina TaxID=424902 RepID=A0A5M8FJJ7_9GAMM|nr:hypothetical protein [Thiohalocapsa marina]KAA6184674.1 hypothetical protein F2Q65_11250 [Thiohalocapsa marina]
MDELTSCAWHKRGLIYALSGQHGFEQSHCHKPTPLQLDEHTLRLPLLRHRRGVRADWRCR